MSSVVGLFSLKSLEAYLKTLNYSNSYPSLAILNKTAEDSFLNAILQCAKQHPLQSKEIIVYALLRVSNICSIDHLVISPQDKSFKKPSIDHGVETSPPNIMIGCAIRSYFIDEFNMLSKNSKEHDIVDSWHVAALYNFGMRLLPFTEIYKIFKLEQKNRLKRNIELCVGRVSDQQSWIYLANLFNKLALHVINEVKNEAKTIMMFHLSHFRQMWNELRTIFYDILAHEVENIITRFVGEAGRIYDDNSGIGLSLGSGNEWKSEVRTSGNMLVIDDDINERVRTCGIRDTDLILELLKCCRKIEDSFAAIALKISDNVMPVVKVNNDVNNDSVFAAEGVTWDWSHLNEGNFDNSKETSHFRPFVGDVINAMNLDICFNSLTIMEEEWGIIQAHKSFKATARPIVVKAGGSSLTVFRSTAVLVDAVQKYSVCALSSKDSLMPITASFVTCIKQQYIEMKNHLLKISRSVGHSCITSLLYPTLGSVMMLKNCLVKFLSKQEYKSDFQVVINEMASVQQVILEQIFDSHKHILSTSVLFDDDSNIWTDSKPFHEDERCSFSIQMWKFHMQALQQDLWLNVPCVESQELYGMIMKYSLKVLIARYSHVVVSLSRVKQLHADITSILLFAREILPYIVMDLSSFFGFCKQNVAQSIHNLCSALLLIAVALTTPLETLYKVCKLQSRNCPIESYQGTDEKTLRNMNTRWLQICHESTPHVNNVLLIQLKILLSQPVMNRCALLQILAVNDAKLSKILLENPSILVEPVLEHTDDSVSSLFSSLHSFRRTYQFCLLYILAHCKSVNECFSDIFMRVLDSNWYSYLGELATNEKLQIPCWFSLLQTLLQPILQPMLEKVMLCVMENVNLTESLRIEISRFISMLEAKMNCMLLSCDKDEVLMNALFQMLSTMKMSVIYIPDTVSILFSKLNDSIDKKNPCTHLTSVGFKIIIVMMKRWLSTVIEKLTAIPSRFNNNIEMLRQFEKLLLHICYPNLRGMVTSELQNSLCRRYQEVENVAEYINNHFNIVTSNCRMKVSLKNECADPCYLLASDSAVILSSTSGQYAIQAIYQFLINEQKWIYTKFVADDNEILLPNNMNVLPNSFSPFEDFARIGSSGYTFAQISLRGVIFDFEEILKNDSALTNLSFSTLLSHRWEFQPGACLNDDECKYVTALKTCLNIHKSEP